MKKIFVDELKVGNEVHIIAPLKLLGVIGKKSRNSQKTTEYYCL